MRGDARQFVLSASLFLLLAVVMLTAADWGSTPPAEPAKRFGPAQLPFVCHLVRDGRSADRAERSLTLRLDDGGDGGIAYCAVITRGTGETPFPAEDPLCFSHRADAAGDLWVDDARGQMEISRDGSARYFKHERAPGADAFGPSRIILYTGSCGG